MGIFHVFSIAQMVPNRAKHHIVTLLWSSASSFQPQAPQWEVIPPSCLFALVNNHFPTPRSKPAVANFEYTHSQLLPNSHWIIKAIKSLNSTTIVRVLITSFTRYFEWPYCFVKFHWFHKEETFFFKKNKRCGFYVKKSGMKYDIKSTSSCSRGNSHKRMLNMLLLALSSIISSSIRMLFRKKNVITRLTIVVKFIF